MTTIAPASARLRLRLFASAREAVGTDEVALTLPAGATIADALSALRPASGQPLDAVLARCSFLVDGVAATERSTSLDGATTLDVLPPFAGG